MPNGYFGDRITGFAMYDPESQQILIAYPNIGYMRDIHIMKIYSSAAEAAWYIANHPNGKKYYRAVP